MNKIIKLVAIAIIAVFAAVSCSPDVSLSGFDWETANSRHDPANNGKIDLPTAAPHGTPTGTVAQKNGKITFTFPREADFFKADVSGDKRYALEDELKKFLTVHSFEKAGAGTFTADVLSSSGIPYKLFGVQPAPGAGNAAYKKIVTIELERDFSTTVGALSDLVVKISGQNYTYANGLKMDVDQNGVGGEAGYDDLYLDVALEGASVTGFVKPGDKEWTVTLNNVITGINNFTGTATETNNTANYQIATLGSFPSNDMRDAVGALVASGFKLQKFVNGNWVNDKDATYDSATGQIRITEVNYTHNVAYRHYWSGTPILTTTAEYYGVKQRIRVLGGLYAPAPTEKREQYARKIAYTAANVCNNDGIRSYVSGIAGLTEPTFSVWSSDVDGRNAVIQVVFDEYFRSSTNYGISEFPLSAFQGEDAGLKVVRSLTGNPITAANINDGGYSVVNVTKVEYKVEDFPILITGFNRLYITIDPTIDANTIVANGALLINEKIKYACTAPDVVFGDRTEILRGGYKAYKFDGGVIINAVPLNLTANATPTYVPEDSNVDYYEVSYNIDTWTFYSLVLNPTGSVNIADTDGNTMESNINVPSHESFRSQGVAGTQSFRIYVNSGDFTIGFKWLERHAFNDDYAENEDDTVIADTWNFRVYQNFDTNGGRNWAYVVEPDDTIYFWGKTVSDSGGSTNATASAVNLSIKTLHDGLEVHSSVLDYTTSASYKNNTGADVVVEIVVTGASDIDETFGFAFSYNDSKPTDD